ncbi:MAG TPA: cytochrome c [Bryobacteraceae bacterium]|nr:cytochrome c [Bryobacteraceae bacterium]
MTYVSLVGLLGGIVAIASPWVVDPPNPVTYYRDVLPILQAKCQSCHRPGQVAPIAFTSYRQTRAWAERIKTMVLQRAMPPWSPGARYLSFAPHRMLSDRETDIIVRWVDGGALAGDPKDAPPPLYDDITRLLHPDGTY